MPHEYLTLLLTVLHYSSACVHGMLSPHSSVELQYVYKNVPPANHNMAGVVIYTACSVSLTALGSAMRVLRC